MSPPTLPFAAQPPRRDGLPPWVWLLAGGLLTVVLAVIGLLGWGWSTFVAQARTALAEQPVVIEHIGHIEDISSDLVASGEVDDADTFVFRLRGDRGSGTVTARFISDGAERERIEGGQLRLPDGTHIALDPVRTHDED